MLATNAAAPDFEALDQSGNTVRLSDHRGKWVALWWYPKASTPGCTIEGRAFRDSASEFDSAGAVVIGASFDSVEDQRGFAEAEGFPFALISDIDRSIGRSYDAERSPGEEYYERGLPRRISYLIDPEGVIAVAYDLADKSLDEHAAEVLADIAARS